MLEADLRASLSAVRGPAPRVLRADELPSEEALAVTHGWEERIPYVLVTTEQELDQLFSKP